ncbi:protein-ADP-ribose hydrolase [Gemella sanguinis]|uniref:protein-ADP-ribose hydrolase n=1 Tax=Gemella sanguinis TaxID=84135 RepID=UPI0008077138|nr:protein-ADP-ribose hydrolase [Gemella sanguinis]
MEQLDYLIRTLNPNVKIPESKQEKEDLLRTLMNIWEVENLPEQFFDVQDKYLKQKLSEKKIVELEELDEVEKNIYLWQGDITTLKVDAIVNAANKALLGCFIPHHRCIDNAIHTQAGLQLRQECFEIMQKQGEFEKTGQAKITSGYNLPAKYVIHTVGPIIYNSVEDSDKKLLASCYRNCLELALKNNLKSIAFCCISTGEFRFPNDLAAQIAVAEVRKVLSENPDKDIKVVFNVFKDSDLAIYRDILC